MNEVKTEADDDELRPEYDFSQLKGKTRGKYIERYQAGTNRIRLDADVAAAFPDAKSANDALRMLLKIGENAVSDRRS